jgi:hypothetical protein
VTDPSRALAAAPSQHGDGCGCQRCRGFTQGEPGPAVRHGAYSRLSLQPRARALREELSGLVPLGADADAPAIDLLALTLAQVERAGVVLAVEQARSQEAMRRGDPPPERLDRLAADCRSWTNTAARLLDQLGLTPTSRARLAGDLAAASREAGLAQLAAEGRAIRERREAEAGV